MTAGRWDVACNLRDKDHLQDVKDEINNALGLRVTNIRTQHSIFSDAREVLEKSFSSSDRPQVQELLARMEDASVEHSRRFGEAEQTAAAKQTEAAAVS
jgi:plasmid stability protein